MRLIAPNGLEITGTKETIPACEAGIINQGITRRKDGTFKFTYSGYTDVNWNAQHTNKNGSGQRIFYDEAGNEWPENKLLLVDEFPR